MQYPQIYIETQQNYYGNNRTAVRGNMYVNGNNTYSGNSSSWASSSENWYMAYGLGGSATNANPNQYIISITQLDNADFTIGDPRSSDIDNLNSNFTGNAPRYGWESAQDIDKTGNRKLTYYYPTDSSEDKMRWVAPKIRIASSYGVTYNLSKQDAERRCAGYQELQYPAGRWRVPTVGEIEFIMSLSEAGKIPPLFTSNGYYWSAQGRIQATLTNGKLKDPDNSTTNSAVRCVYDEWYWKDSVLQPNGKVQGTDIDKYDFTWGDLPR